MKKFGASVAVVWGNRDNKAVFILCNKVALVLVIAVVVWANRSLSEEEKILGSKKLSRDVTFEYWVSTVVDLLIYDDEQIYCVLPYLSIRALCIAYPV